MPQKILLLTITLLVLVVAALRSQPSDALSKEEALAEYAHLSPRQVMDKADEHYGKGELAEALVGFNILISNSVVSTDNDEQRLIIEAHNKAAIVNYHEGNYRYAYELFVRALSLSEETGETADMIKIYTNIGNIYYRFNAYDRARDYYLQALSLPHDSTSLTVLYNNLGSVEADMGVLDSAMYYLRESMRISRHNDNIYLYSSLNSMASLYQRRQQYDSAFYYYRKALGEARRQSRKEVEADNLSDMGNLFLEIARPDSARHYIDLSNRIATENNLTQVLTQNHLTLYKIAKSRGADDEALNHFERYASLWDSIFNVSHLDEINRIERMHENSKIDRHIEQLTIEQLIKERTITYQRIMQVIMLAGLMVVSAMFLNNFSKRRKLNAAYKVLVEKNQELMEYNGRSAEKYKKGPHPLDASQEELLERILAVMEDAAVACDPKFSINVLASLVQSNHQYVSQVINNGMNKNFRSFRNVYRIKEAQRLFSEPDSGRFTIESVSQQVGFKSRSAFREAFVEVTGVNPTFYLRSMQDKSRENGKF